MKAALSMQEMQSLIAERRGLAARIDAMWAGINREKAEIQSEMDSIDAMSSGGFLAKMKARGRAEKLRKRVLALGKAVPAKERESAELVRRLAEIDFRITGDEAFARIAASNRSPE